MQDVVHEIIALRGEIVDEAALELADAIPNAFALQAPLELGVVDELPRLLERRGLVRRCGGRGKAGMVLTKAGLAVAKEIAD